MTEGDLFSISTEIMQFDSFSFDSSRLAKAIEFLKAGELIVAPTETVYGLLADPLDPSAVSRVYEVKGRDFNKPLALCISSLAQLHQLVEEVPVYAWKIIEAFLPGPLTIVLKKSDKILENITVGLDTVGIRFPDHPVVLSLINQFGRPLAATSANLSGQPSPVNAEEAEKQLKGKVSLIIDSGETKYKQESTVVDLTVEPPRVLREGALPSEKIFDHLKG